MKTLWTLFWIFLGCLGGVGIFIIVLVLRSGAMNKEIDKYVTPNGVIRYIKKHKKGVK